MNFITSNNKIEIVCPIHGSFWQMPTKHIQGQGCPQCGIENRTEKHRVRSDDFISRAKDLHGLKYNYSDVEFVEMDKKVKINCPRHGEFYQRPYDHLQGNACPKCANIESKTENEIYEYCCEIIGKENIIHRDRKEIYPKEIDIYIPSLKLGIEYNGLIWHSEKFEKDKWVSLQ